MEVVPAGNREERESGVREESEARGFVCRFASVTSFDCSLAFLFIVDSVIATISTKVASCFASLTQVSIVRTAN